MIKFQNFFYPPFPIICFLSPAQAFSEATYEKIYRSQKGIGRIKNFTSFKIFFSLAEGEEGEDDDDDDDDDDHYGDTDNDDNNDNSNNSDNNDDQRQRQP